MEEGAAIPQTEVKTQENLVKLHKRGRMLVASYEAIRWQKLDLFSVTLRQIGAHINRMLLEDAIGVLITATATTTRKEYKVGTSPSAARPAPSPTTIWWTSGPSSTPTR